MREILETKRFHSRGHPCLISSLVLRSHGLGQIDIAYLEKVLEKNKTQWRLQIIEVKSSTTPSKTQWQRLLRAQDYLSKVLEVESNLKVKFCKNDQDSLSF